MLLPQSLLDLECPLLAPRSLKPANQGFQPTRLISAAERAEKIAKGLCYFCDNPYERGHRCPTKRSQLFLVEVPADTPEEEELVEDLQPPPVEQQAMGFEMLEPEPFISLQALNGIQGYQTMRVTGYVGKKAIQILIDTGSTHNFVNQSLAQRLGCKLDVIHSQPIAVADGSELKCHYICHNFTWRLQNTDFCSDVLLISLGSCDMVLGVQWLSQLGTIQWNFKTLHMEFTWEGKKHVLRGMQGPKVRLIQGTQLPQALNDGFQACMLQLLPIQERAHAWSCLTLQQVQNQLQQGQPVSHYTIQDGLLRKKGRLVIGPDLSLRTQLLQWVHDSPFGGHSGRDATLKRLKSLFWWRGMTKAVQAHVRQCLTCQSCKYDTSPNPGLLQPVQISQEVWRDVSMDFIEGLPKSCGKEVIFVVVDRFSKYAHFIGLSHPYTALEVAQAYLDHVFKLHGWPHSIISDRDKVFLSDFWQALLSIQGSLLLMSTAYHPQTDGQTEVVNRCLETYLRCMCSEKTHEWSK